MNFDDLIQLLIIGGAALAWLLGSSKTKKRPQPRPPARRPAPPIQRREAPTTVVVRPETRPRRPADTMAEEIYRMLSGEVEQRERDESIEVMREEAAPRRESLEEIHEVEAYSLETLEPAGEESHKRFHEKYAAPSQPAQPAMPEPSAERARRLRLTVNPRSLREAILWREILGPPKGA